MYRNLKPVLVLVVFLSFGSEAHAYKPMIHKILIDASGSISNSDFRTMNAAVANFIDILYKRSQVHLGQAAEWVSISWFGGEQEYESTIFINCSNKTQMEQAKLMLLTMSHPQYESTGIYSAICYGTIETMEQDKKLPYAYFKDLVLITDGDDNASAAEYISAVRSNYPNEQVYLFVVGVGTQAVVRQFAPLATSVEHVDNFDALEVFFVLLGEALD